MASNETADEPSYLENLLFLVGAFLTSALATAIVVSIPGIEGIVESVITPVVFVAAFIGLLFFYNSYYLSD